MKQGQRIDYWDNIKGLLILLVVLGHYSEYLIPFNKRYEFLWTAIYCLHMPAFIFINGYFLRRSSENPIDQIPRFLGLYLLMELLEIVNTLLHGDGVNLDLAKPQFGCWYLLFLIYAHLLTYYIKGTRRPIPILAAALAGGLLSGFDTTLNNQMRIGQSLYYMPFLILGLCFDVDRLVSWAKRHRLWCLGGFVALQCCIFMVRYESIFKRRIVRGLETYEELSLPPLTGFLERCCVYAVSALLVVFLLGLITEKKTFISALGRHTLMVYLVHTFLLKNMMSDLERIDSLDIFGSLAIVTAATAAVCVLLISGNRKLSHMRAG